MIRSESLKFSQLYKNHLFVDPHGSQDSKIKLECQTKLSTQQLSSSVGKFSRNSIKSSSSLRSDLRVRTVQSPKQINKQAVKAMPTTLLTQKHLVHQKYAHVRTQTSTKSLSNLQLTRPEAPLLKQTFEKNSVDLHLQKLMIIKNVHKLFQTQSFSQRKQTYDKQEEKTQANESLKDWFQRTNEQLLLQRLELQEQENKQQGYFNQKETANNFKQSQLYKQVLEYRDLHQKRLSNQLKSKQQDGEILSSLR